MSARRVHARRSDADFETLPDTLPELAQYACALVSFRRRIRKRTSCCRGCCPSRQFHCGRGRGRIPAGAASGCSCGSRGGRRSRVGRRWRRRGRWQRRGPVDDVSGCGNGKRQLSGQLAGNGGLAGEWYPDYCNYRGQAADGAVAVARGARSAGGAGAGVGRSSSRGFGVKRRGGYRRRGGGRRRSHTGSRARGTTWSRRRGAPEASMCSQRKEGRRSDGHIRPRASSLHCKPFDDSLPRSYSKETEIAAWKSIHVLVVVEGVDPRLLTLSAN